MYTNIILWMLIAIFVGIIGYLFEVNKGKNLLSNIFAAFIGVFISAFITYFFIWPEAGGGINAVAAIVSIIFGFIAVKLEDYVFLRV